MYDLVLPGGTASSYPRCTEFIDFILPQLSTLIQDSESNTVHDGEKDSTKYGGAASGSQESSSNNNNNNGNNNTLFGAKELSPVGELPKSPFSDSERISSVLSAVHNDNNGGSQSPIISPLVKYMSGLEGPSPLVGRENKETLRISAKIKLKDSCDLSSDIRVCEPMPMNILPLGSISFEKNNEYENSAKSPVNGFFKGCEEKKGTIRLMNTMCRWLVGQMGRCYNGVTPEMYR